MNKKEVKFSEEIYNVIIDSYNHELDNTCASFQYIDEIERVVQVLEDCKFELKPFEENENFIDGILEVPYNNKLFLESRKDEIEKIFKEYFDEFSMSVYKREVRSGEIIIKIKRSTFEKDKSENLIKVPYDRNKFALDSVICATNEETEENKYFIYDNLLNDTVNNNYDDIEVRYIQEACECGKRNYILAATTMIGCAAERLLNLLSLAYLDYLKKNVEVNEINKFKQDVVDVTKAHKKLNNFIIKVKDKKKLFQELGFENPELNFMFLDVIRQARNDSGHPTGNILSESELASFFTAYHITYKKVHELIIKLKE